MVGVVFLPDGSPDWSRVLAMGIVVCCLVALGTAYTAQYSYDLDPCILCLYQRIPYAVAGLLGFAAIMARRGRLRHLLVVACFPVFLASAGLAFYHVGVEQHWWESAAGCGGSIPQEMSVEDFQSSLFEKPAKSCDQADWTLFGVSMATYNVFASLLIAVTIMVGLRGRRGW